MTTFNLSNPKTLPASQVTSPSSTSSASSCHHNNRMVVNDWEKILHGFKGDIRSALSHLTTVHNETCACQTGSLLQEATNKVWNQKKVPFIELQKLSGLDFDDYLNRALRLLINNSIRDVEPLSESELWQILQSSTFPVQPKNASLSSSTGRQLACNQEEASSLNEDDLADIHTFIANEIGAEPAQILFQQPGGGEGSAESSLAEVASSTSQLTAQSPTFNTNTKQEVEENVKKTNYAPSSSAHGSIESNALRLCQPEAAAACTSKSCFNVKEEAKQNSLHQLEGSQDGVKENYHDKICGKKITVSDASAQERDGCALGSSPISKVTGVDLYGRLDGAESDASPFIPVPSDAAVSSASSIGGGILESSISDSNDSFSLCQDYSTSGKNPYPHRHHLQGRQQSIHEKLGSTKYLGPISNSSSAIAGESGDSVDFPVNEEGSFSKEEGSNTLKPSHGGYSSTSTLTTLSASANEKHKAPIDCTGVPAAFGMSWFCRMCSRQHHDRMDCSFYSGVHRPKFILNNAEENDDNALGLPSVLVCSADGTVFTRSAPQINNEDQKAGGETILTDKQGLKALTRLGPLRGVKECHENEVDFDEDRKHVWLVHREDGTRRCILAPPGISGSNWVASVAPAQTAAQANVLAISSGNQLYLVVFPADIPPGAQLRFYAKEDPAVEFWTNWTRAWSGARTRCARCSTGASVPSTESLSNDGDEAGLASVTSSSHRSPNSNESSMASSLMTTSNTPPMTSTTSTSYGNMSGESVADYRVHVALWHDVSFAGNPQNRIYYCPDCGARRVGAKDIVRHCRAQHGTLPFACRRCGRRFETYNSLAKHRSRLHAAEKPLRKECSRCGKVYLDPKALKQHVRQVHERSAQLHCTAGCEFIFSSKYALGRHVREVHNRRQEHTCLHCSKQFTQHSNLKQHMLIHIGAKPFPCRDCKSAFTTKQCLQVHYRKVHRYRDSEMPPIRRDKTLDEYCKESLSSSTSTSASASTSSSASASQTAATNTVENTQRSESSKSTCKTASKTAFNSDTLSSPRASTSIKGAAKTGKPTDSSKAESASSSAAGSTKHSMRICSPKQGIIPTAAEAGPTGQTCPELLNRHCRKLAASGEAVESKADPIKEKLEVSKEETPKNDEKASPSANQSPDKGPNFRPALPPVPALAMNSVRTSMSSRIASSDAKGNLATTAVTFSMSSPTMTSLKPAAVMESSSHPPLHPDTHREHQQYTSFQQLQHQHQHLLLNHGFRSGNPYFFHPSSHQVGTTHNQLQQHEAHCQQQLHPQMPTHLQQQHQQLNHHLHQVPQQGTQYQQTLQNQGQSNHHPQGPFHHYNNLHQFLGESHAKVSSDESTNYYYDPNYMK